MSLLSIGKYIWKICKWLSPFAAAVTLFFALIDNIDFVIDHMDELEGFITTAQGHTQSSALAGFYAKANRIVPLTEMFAMAVLLLHLKLLALIVRIIKSFVPTIN